jgi:uncharacterized protein (UPF0297 family)
MKKGTTRKGVNVTEFRNFLFEMDKYNKKEQAALIKRSKLPWSTVVDSGNKSLHFIVALDQDLGDRSMYTAYFKAINTVLTKYGADIDEGCKDPGRFTRAPFGVNTKETLVNKKPNIHDRIQKVGAVRGRVTQVAIDEWLQKHDVNVLDFIETPVVRSEIKGSTSNAEVELKADWVEKYILKNHPSYEEGNYNYQYALACGMLRAGCTAHEIEAYYISKWNHIHENNPIKGALGTINTGEEIYVPTMDERREYYRQLDEAELLSSNRSGYNREGIDVEKIEARPEDINRYEVIGTEYFKVDSVNDNLIPWSKPMFEKLYGSRAIPTRLYDKFGYKPDYISEEFPRDLGVDGKTRNIFIRPTYKIEPGNWDTIKGGLQHGFPNHYQNILEYCAILIAYPEAKLPNLWFIGKENKGKSAVVAIFKYLIGLQNVRKISTKALESDFTDFLGASQLVIVEEAGNWKNPNEVMSNLKDWTTEQDTQWVNPKYGKKYESPIHCKFMFTSNDWDSAPISGDATRIWFVEINHDPKNKVTNYYQKIQDEMGHFADYLVKQVVPTLKIRNGNLDTSERLYFNPSEYENSAKDFIRQLHKDPVLESIMDTVCDFFEKYPEEETCNFDLKSIKEANEWNYSKDPNTKKIKLVLKEELDIEATNPLDRHDSLRFISDTKPKRRSHWFCITRQQAIGDSIFNMEAVTIA